MRPAWGLDSKNYANTFSVFSTPSGVSAAKSSPLPGPEQGLAPNLAHEVLGNSYTLPKVIATIAITVIDGFTDIYIRHTVCRIKGVEYFAGESVPSKSQLIFQDYQKPSNVWHQYLSSSSISYPSVSVRWWRRRSYPHSWREVNLTSISLNCTYLCISLCWTMPSCHGTWSPSPLLWQEGIVISLLNLRQFSDLD